MCIEHPIEQHADAIDSALHLLLDQSESKAPLGYSACVRFQLVKRCTRLRRRATTLGIYLRKNSLEHGAVWITYDPGADVDVAALEDALPQNGILSPYDGLDAPVVVTVWGRQLELDGADDPRLELFIDTLGGGETAPEPFASCAGGVRDPGGEPGANV